ncbi:hypothetical protein ACTA71_006014 [Dictyostelium dimigraforme]
MFLRDSKLVELVEEEKCPLHVTCIRSTSKIRNGKGVEICAFDQQSCHNISLCIIKFLYNHQDITMTVYTFSIIRELVNEDQECCLKKLNQIEQKKADNRFIKMLGSGGYIKEYQEVINSIIAFLNEVKNQRKKRFGATSLTMENLIKKLEVGDAFDKEKCDCTKRYNDGKAHKYNC